MAAESAPAERTSPPARGPWWWVPSLYFAQALPNVLVTTVSTYPYTRLGLSAITIGYTKLLGLPWTLKPLWSPLVELIGTERRWIWTTEYLAAVAMAVIGFGYAQQHFLLWTMAGYLLLAAASATHDIAADGFYMRALPAHDQTWFSGIRSVAFRGGWIYAEAVLVGIAGILIRAGYDPAHAWAATHGVGAMTIFAVGSYHALFLPALPEKPSVEDRSVGRLAREVAHIFREFFREVPVATALPFLLLYRFAEAQAVAFFGMFLLDSRAAGGLELIEDQVALINGTLGVAALLVGGVLGGMLAARHGLRAWLFPMAVFMNMTNLAFLALAYFQPQSLAWIALAAVIEKFGYGLGFTGYMLYMLYLSQGKHQTSFYAMCTGFMWIGLNVPAALAGYPLEWLGYTGFFTWVIVATIPSFIVTWIVVRQMDPKFGRREAQA
jgi:PAT family beta-lactamase induction signal transducer AmpG